MFKINNYSVELSLVFFYCAI